MNWCSRASSIAPLRVQVDIRVRELELSGIRGVSRHRSGPVRPDSSRARAPSPRRVLCSTPSCSDLALPRDVLHLNLVFVRTCPRVFPLYGFSRREAVILCGTSCALVVSGIRIVSRLCSHRLHFLFLALNFAFFSSSSSRYLAVSLVNGTLHLLGNCRSIVDRLSSDTHIFSSTSFLVAFQE